MHFFIFHFILLLAKWQLKLIRLLPTRIFLLDMPADSAHIFF